MKRMDLRSAAALVALLSLLSSRAVAAQPPAAEDPTSRGSVLYAGPTRADIDATTLDGKVLCGYQGWFNTPGDGTDFGFSHWGRGWIGRAAAGSRSTCGPTSRSTTRRTWPRFRA